MKNRLTYVILSASVLAASWGGWLVDPLTWSDGVF